MGTGINVAIRSVQASPITRTSGNLCCLNLLTIATVHTFPNREITKITIRETVFGKSMTSDEVFVELFQESLPIGAAAFPVKSSMAEARFNLHK